MSHLTSLVHVWLGQKVNLPLAEPFVAPITVAVAQFANATSWDDWVTQHASLLETTDRPIALDANTSVNDFFSQLLGHGLRWDVLGIFFSAAGRAALDTTSFPPLYTDDAQRWDLIKSLTYIGDCCLETCLAADRLDDLQLVLQYENCIVHSQVDGDQSKSSPGAYDDVDSAQAITLGEGWGTFQALFSLLAIMKEWIQTFLRSLQSCAKPPSPGSTPPTKAWPFFLADHRESSRRTANSSSLPTHPTFGMMRAAVHIPQHPITMRTTNQQSPLTTLQIPAALLCLPA